jgi:hypothetical protein
MMTGSFWIFPVICSTNLVASSNTRDCPTLLPTLTHDWTWTAEYSHTADLDNNDRVMKQPCDVNQPIEVLYKQIEDAIKFASAGQTLYSLEQVLSIAYQLIF